MISVESASPWSTTTEKQHDTSGAAHRSVTRVWFDRVFAEVQREVREGEVHVASSR